MSWIKGLVFLCLFAGLHCATQAGVLNYCDQGREPSAGERSITLQFSELVRKQLEQSGSPVALISFAGLDLQFFDIRYSHMGIALRNSPQSPWSVRQLYFDCDEKKGRLFDQGLAGFLTGKSTGDTLFVSVVFLPSTAATVLEKAALDNKLALSLLNPHYSANAYPYSTLYQNCNQWVAEMLAAAWSGMSASDDARAQAQRWLQSRAYSPSMVPVHTVPLMWISGHLPWLHRNDHPEADQRRLLYQISMPASVETFVHAMIPSSERLEICIKGKQVVLHKGWKPLEGRCQAGEGDQTLSLAPAG
ncbi:DUF2145 domain-containing protein [Curvibacter sp. CHRR-16]|uniref:DUF2145 domain-containing protein n=1 Tax=Curvibacter sp. CHRR-16 TaxID=2835872 RepID=UPI001BD9AD7C|nr:DUF2145 domain-containing protein [Curvibacter sp. CHRR-16]MBT0569304.1 DUF2145 domain-containing protein [Curvibacter sp. CHRR-16]